MSILQKLTEGVQHRDLRAEGAALLNKWEATGLLEGLDGNHQKQGMAVLLENQAKELLREASSMAAGDVEGFAAVAFPIVRRVFGGLIANDLVSVQPMSLPSGLIFFLDFVHSEARLGARQGESIYGGNVVARGLTGGVDLSPANPLGGGQGGPGGHYDFGHAASAATASVNLPNNSANLVGAFTDIDLDKGISEAEKKHLRYDPDLLALCTGSDGAAQLAVTAMDLKKTVIPGFDETKLAGIVVAPELGHDDLGGASGSVTQVRRLTQVSPDDADAIRIFFVGDAATLAGPGDGSNINTTIKGANAGTITYPLADSVNAATFPGAVVAGGMGLEEPLPRHPGNFGTDGAGKTQIAEIDIKVDSIAVTAQTKKLKAKWSPELGQDLNAYHNLDAEVELTGILSEQIALEIDRELLGDLVNGAKAGTRYWSRAPGLFVDSTGAEVGASSAAPDFTGTVSEWYETLIETINDVSAQIHRKTLRGGANFVVCSPEVANILEFTSGFRASVTADQDRGTIGAVRAGSLSKKFDVYVDPYFLRNVILVGRKGSSFLESGFVYAPYVPLQVTPTIFGTEDFVPRKGVMTRYAKKMVRPDMYGLVVVRGLLGEAGKTA